MGPKRFRSPASGAMVCERHKSPPRAPGVGVVGVGATPPAPAPRVVDWSAGDYTLGPTVSGEGDEGEQSNDCTKGDKWASDLARRLGLWGVLGHGWLFQRDCWLPLLEATGAIAASKDALGIVVSYLATPHVFREVELRNVERLDQGRTIQGVSYTGMALSRYSLANAEHRWSFRITCAWPPDDVYWWVGLCTIDKTATQQVVPQNEIKLCRGKGCNVLRFLGKETELPNLPANCLVTVDVSVHTRSILFSVDDEPVAHINLEGINYDLQTFYPFINLDSALGNASSRALLRASFERSTPNAHINK